MPNRPKVYKTCDTCGEIKNLPKEFTHGRNGYYDTCKTCVKLLKEKEIEAIQEPGERVYNPLWNHPWISS